MEEKIKTQVLKRDRSFTKTKSFLATISEKRKCAVALTLSRKVFEIFAPQVLLDQLCVSIVWFSTPPLLRLSIRKTTTSHVKASVVGGWVCRQHRVQTDQQA